MSDIALPRRKGANLKLLYIATRFTTHDLRFVESFFRRGVEVDLVALSRGAASAAQSELPPEVRVWMPPDDCRDDTWVGEPPPQIVNYCRRVFENVRPDLVQAGPVHEGALLAVRAGCRPLISVSWGYDLLRDVGLGRWHRAVAEEVLAVSDWVVTDAQVVTEQAVRLGASRGRICSFPWGVDLAHFRPTGGMAIDRRALGWLDAFVVVHTRCLDYVHGSDLMVDGFLRAARRVPQMRLLLIGDGPDAARVRESLACEDVNERVVFCGQVSQRDLPSYYRAADVYLSASRTDGSSVSLLEAMASGLPTVISDIPGNREWADRGGAYLFSLEESDSLAAGLVSAFEDRHLGLGAQSRRMAYERANWESNFNRFMSICREAAV